MTSDAKRTAKIEDAIAALLKAEGINPADTVRATACLSQCVAKTKVLRIYKGMNK